MKTKHENIKNDIMFVTSNFNDIAKLKIARKQFDDYFSQSNIDDTMNIMMLIDELIESLCETNDIAMCELFAQITCNNDLYDESICMHDETKQRLTKRIMLTQLSRDDKFDYIFDNIELIDNIIDDNELSFSINAMNIQHNDDNDELKLSIIERIETILNIKIL